MDSTAEASVEILLLEPEKPPDPPNPPGPLYRAFDWRLFAVTSLLLVVVYLWTMPPEIDLEDGGELATASMWAGVPNPPGHPLWTIVTWVAIKIVPFSNVAWRVALVSAVSAAVGCGLVAMMVGRGTRMMIEGIGLMNGIEPRRQNAICVVAGAVAGMLLGLNQTVWNQAVRVQTYAFSMMLLAVMLTFTLRWVYAPHQRRYVYGIAFLFGVCVTSHQVMIIAAMGMEMAVIAVDLKLGRDILVVNCLCWIVGLWFGLGSVAHSIFLLFHVIGALSLAMLIVLVAVTRRFLTEWKAVLMMVVAYLLGTCFYFYLPLASMGDPPMNWGNPRTVEGFWHVLSRGQYDKANPPDIFGNPMLLVDEAGMYFTTAAADFDPYSLFLAAVPFLLLVKMQKRERGWLIGLAGIFLCLSVLLMVMLSPMRERQTSELIKRFLICSYVLLALFIGYGMGLTAAWMEVKWGTAQIKPGQPDAYQV